MHQHKYVILLKTKWVNLCKYLLENIWCQRFVALGILTDKKAESKDTHHKGLNGKILYKQRPFE